MGRVFDNSPADLGSIPGRVIPKTLKMVLDTALLNTQQYKVRIKGKMEQSRERSSALPYTSVWQLLKREPSGHPRLKVDNFTYLQSENKTRQSNHTPPPTYTGNQPIFPTETIHTLYFQGFLHYPRAGIMWYFFRFIP